MTSSSPLPDGLQLFHTGLVVEDLDEAMARWRALGTEFAPPSISTAAMVGAAGVLRHEVRFTYSLRGPHFVELIEQLDPTPYLSLTGGRHVHHLGFRTTDLPGDSARLESLGYPRELAGASEDGSMERVAFHRDPLSPGMWLELVSADTVTRTMDWIAAAAAERGIEFVLPPLLTVTT